MKIYPSKEALIEAIQSAYHKYDQEFADIPEEKKHLAGPAGAKTPSQHLSYQLGWTHLLLAWECQEKGGEEVITPQKGFTWNRLGDLYQHFYEQYGTGSLSEQRAQLTRNVQAICQWIDQLSESELFAPHQRKWADAATSKAIWPVYKFIHINTVAPFTNFRTQIRKWKKTFL